MPPREKGAKACLQDWAGHFLRSALRERFAQLRPIRAISQELQAVFSARQTLWWREVDSNPRYRFGWCKSRRFRKLHGIKYFRESGRRNWQRKVSARLRGQSYYYRTIKIDDQKK